MTFSITPAALKAAAKRVREAETKRLSQSLPNTSILNAITQGLGLGQSFAAFSSAAAAARPEEAEQKLTVWTVTYNDDSSSPFAEVCTTAVAAEAAKREWLASYEDTYPDVDYTQSNDDIFDALCEELGFIDSCTVQEHTIMVPLHR